jgi:hypothetical protein
MDGFEYFQLLCIFLKPANIGDMNYRITFDPNTPTVSGSMPDACAEDDKQSVTTEDLDEDEVEEVEVLSTRYYLFRKFNYYIS